jgi:hypothetical protein
LELLKHPLYSVDLAPSDFHLFGLLRKLLGDKHFTDDEEVETEVQKWLKQQSKRLLCYGLTHWYCDGTNVLMLVEDT